MAFSDFSLEAAQQRLGVTTEPANLFPSLPEVAVPAWLPDSLARGTQLALISEKSRSEFIVAPILLATRELVDVPLAVFSGQRLDVDPERGLVGECDFILALGPSVPPLRAPLATIVEAKKNDVEAGLGQCVAQMVAGRSVQPDRGGPGDSHLWLCDHGRDLAVPALTGSVAQIDQRRFYIDNLSGILAALRAVVLAHQCP